jgi:cell division protein FtsX
MVIGGMLLDAARFPASAAQAEAGPGYFVYGLEWYLQQFVQWIQTGIDSTFSAYNLDASGLYCIALTLSVLAVFVCLMAKAFTLGKLAAERVSRDR